MTGLEMLAIARMISERETAGGGSPLPVEDLSRIIRKLGALLDSKNAKPRSEFSFSPAELLWLQGDLVDAAVAYAEERGTDVGAATNALKERLGDVPLVTILERRVDALLEHEGLVWDGES